MQRQNRRARELPIHQSKIQVPRPDAYAGGNREYGFQFAVAQKALNSTTSIFDRCMGAA